jgi:hypothetical protein
MFNTKVVPNTLIYLQYFPEFLLISALIGNLFRKRLNLLFLNGSDPPTQPDPLCRPTPTATLAHLWSLPPIFSQSSPCYTRVHARPARIPPESHLTVRRCGLPLAAVPTLTFWCELPNLVRCRTTALIHWPSPWKPFPPRSVKEQEDKPPPRPALSPRHLPYLNHSAWPRSQSERAIGTHHNALHVPSC